MASIAAITDQARADDFASDDPPLIRGGSESVYRVTPYRGAGLSWRHATERIVDDACRRFDDARVAEVRTLRCRVGPGGDIRIRTELSLSTRFQRGRT